LLLLMVNMLSLLGSFVPNDSATHRQGYSAWASTPSRNINSKQAPPPKSIPAPSNSFAVKTTETGIDYKDDVTRHPSIHNSRH
jgi:hypothetical protein